MIYPRVINLQTFKPLFCLVLQMNKLLLTLFLLLSYTVQAVATIDLYSGEVVVASQDEADRKDAIPEALIRVFQKLSGKRELSPSAVLDEALLNAERLMVSFRYRNVDRLGPDGAIARELRLVVQFLQPEVDKLVHEIGLQRWPQQRPAVQIWVVVDDGRSRGLKPLEYEYAWGVMEDVAMSRGLPISWPEMDEEEAQLVDTGLLWGGFTDYLIEKGAPGDGVAIVSARRDGPQWTLGWSLTAGDQNWRWRNDDQELMLALSNGIHKMADQMSEASAIPASQQGQWSTDITITGLSSANDYIRCLEYLQNITLVTAIEVLAAEPGQLHLRMQINASPEFLTEFFNRDSVLLSAGSADEFKYEFLQ